VKNFSARLRFCFLQTCASTEQPFETKHDGNWNLAARLFQALLHLLLDFQPGYVRAEKSGERNPDMQNCALQSHVPRQNFHTRPAD
jgi:hypothetical protein